MWWHIGKPAKYSKKDWWNTELLCCLSGRYGGLDFKEDDRYALITKRIRDRNIPVRKKWNGVF